MRVSSFPEMLMIAHYSGEPRDSISIRRKRKRERDRERERERERETDLKLSLAHWKSITVFCRKRQLAQGDSRCIPTILPCNSAIACDSRSMPLLRVFPDVIYSLLLNDAYFQSRDSRVRRRNLPVDSHDVGRDSDPLRMCSDPRCSISTSEVDIHD